MSSHHQILCMLLMAVARFSTGGVAITCLLPVLDDVMFANNAGRSGLVVSASGCCVRGPRFESHSGRLCLSRQPL